MNQSHLSCSIHVLLFAFIAGSANAAFIGRLETAPSSGIFQAYYDDQLDITWAANANINGAALWDDHVSWVTSLGIGGVGGWRLPDMDVNNDGTVVGCSPSDQVSCQDNEYGHLYFYGAGTAWANGVRFGAPGPFSDIQPFSYWSNTVVAPVDAWSFALSNGSQAHYWTENNLFAWAVHDGDVGGTIVYADFDGDNDIDGLDFLKWQRGDTPELGSADELALWESQYGTTVPPLSALVVSTPEPTTLLLASLAGCALLHPRRRR